MVHVPGIVTIHALVISAEVTINVIICNNNKNISLKMQLNPSIVITGFIKYRN